MTWRKTFRFPSFPARPAVQAGPQIGPQEAEGLPRQPDGGAGRDHVQEGPQPGAFQQPEQLWRGGERLHRQRAPLLGGADRGQHMVSATGVQIFPFGAGPLPRPLVPV